MKRSQGYLLSRCCCSYWRNLQKLIDSYLYHYKVNLTLTACTRFRRLLARNCRKVKPRKSLTRWKNLYHGTVYTTTFLRTYNVGYKDGNESKTHFFPPYPVTTHFSNDNFHFTIFFNRKWYSRSLLVVI